MVVTFCLIKPDAVRRHLIGVILRRVEAAGLEPVRLEMVRPNRSLLDEHYRAHRAWGGLPEMLAFMGSGPTVACVFSGSRAVERLREQIGPFRVGERVPGTIRGDFMAPGYPLWENLVHGSDSVDEAAREVRLWFGADSCKEAICEHGVPGGTFCQACCTRAHDAATAGGDGVS
jgi:nucleoside-diphosphate kinase